MSIGGGCHCGAVRYVLAETPTYSMVCHCRTCQGVSGAPVVAWVSALAADFRFTAGAPARYASSPGVTRQFCGACGTQLTYARGDSRHEVDIATATLDDPNLCPPTHHSWTSHDIRWVKFGDGLPTFSQSRSQG